MAKQSSADTVLGAVLVVLGVLVLVGILDIPFLVEAVGILAILAGILMLTGKVRGSTTAAVVVIVLGVLLLVPNLLGGLLASLLKIGAGVLLLVLGVTKLLGRW